MHVNSLKFCRELMNSPAKPPNNAGLGDNNETNPHELYFFVFYYFVHCAVQSISVSRWVTTYGNS